MKDDVLGDALAGLGITDGKPKTQSSAVKSSGVVQSPPPPMVHHNEDMCRELRLIVVLLALGLAFYVGHSLWNERRIHEARQELQKAGLEVQRALRR